MQHLNCKSAFLPGIVVRLGDGMPVNVSVNLPLVPPAVIPAAIAAALPPGVSVFGPYRSGQQITLIARVDPPMAGEDNYIFYWHIDGDPEPARRESTDQAMDIFKTAFDIGTHIVQVFVDRGGARQDATIVIVGPPVPQVRIRITSPANNHLAEIKEEPTTKDQYHDQIQFSVSVTNAARPYAITWTINGRRWAAHDRETAFSIGGPNHPIRNLLDPQTSLTQGAHRIRATVRDADNRRDTAEIMLYVGRRGQTLKEISEAHMLEPQLAYKDFGTARRGRVPWQLGGKSKLAGGFERKGLALRAAERRGAENLPRVTMAINKGKYELNNVARSYAEKLYKEYQEELEIIKKAWEDARDAYYAEWKRLAGFTQNKMRFFKYTVRRGFKMPLGMGGSNEILEDILEKEKMTNERRKLRDLFEKFSKAETAYKEFTIIKLKELEDEIRKRLEPAAKNIAKKYIWRYKIGPDFEDARKYIESQMDEEAAVLAEHYARTGQARLRGMLGLMTRLSMKSNSLRNIWYTMLYNIWDFIWGPMFFGLIMAIFVMWGFISMFILPTYNLNPSLFLYIIPLLGAGLNLVMNFESNKYALDYMDSMVSGALIAQGITIFLFALIGPPGVWLNSLPYYLLFAFLFIFFGVFQFYQTGGFPVVVKMAAIVLIFGWVALGPYKAVYEGAINQVRTPVLVAWRAGSNAVYDVWLLVTNPTQWYAKQQTINVKPEKPISIPRALEVASIDVLPQPVPQGNEFAMVMVIKNEGDLPARNIDIRDEEGKRSVGCNTYCDKRNAVVVLPDKRHLLPGDAERVEIRQLKAIKDPNREFEFRLGIVFINLSYEYSTNSSLLVSVMTKQEFQRRFAEKEDVFRQVVAVGKASPAKLSLNVGPQPLEAKKEALLLIAVANDRDDGRIFLRKEKFERGEPIGAFTVEGTQKAVRLEETRTVGDFIILRMQKVVGSKLNCGAGGIPVSSREVNLGPPFNRRITVDFDKDREEVLVYKIPQDQEIRQFEFKTVFSLLCKFTTADVPSDKGVQTGLITAELPTYEFRIIKEQNIPITAAVGIIANPNEEACNVCGTRAGTLASALAVCNRNECRGIRPPQGSCWLDTSERLPGPGTILDSGICRSCINRQCSSFEAPYDCETEAKQQCVVHCRWLYPDSKPYSLGVVSHYGRCVEARPPGFLGSVNYCENRMKNAPQAGACREGEGECKDDNDCAVLVPKLQCRRPSGFDFKLCCTDPAATGKPLETEDRNCIAQYQDNLKKQEQKQALTAPVVSPEKEKVKERIRLWASQMENQLSDADKQRLSEVGVSKFEDLVLKVAGYETRSGSVSTYRHCKDGTLTCSNTRDDFNGVLCSSANSCGVMQIHLSSHKASTFGCPSFADLECNIASGIQILINGYKNFKGGFEDAVKRGIVKNPDALCSDSRFRQTYLDYRGWKAAVRGYNGWGCAIGADVNYVENVIKQGA